MIIDIKTKDALYFHLFHHPRILLLALDKWERNIRRECYSGALQINLLYYLQNQLNFYTSTLLNLLNRHFTVYYLLIQKQ